MSTARSGKLIGPTEVARRSTTRSWRLQIANSAWTYRLIVLVIVGVAWQAYAIAAQSLFIPKFTDTVVGVFRLATDPNAIGAFGLSNHALVLGFAISVVLGIPLGLAAARYHLLEGLIDPYLSILLVTPMAALVPLVIMSTGIGLVSRVLLVLVFSIPIIIVNTRTGVRQVDPDLIEMATSYGATEGQVWRKILLPGAFPALMTGVRLGLGRAVTGMVVVELLMVSVGIGGLILNYRGTLEPDLLYAVVVLVVLEALLLVSTVRFLERKLAPWASELFLRE